jgi:hypothetical protein
MLCLCIGTKLIRGQTNQIAQQSMVLRTVSVAASAEDSRNVFVLSCSFSQFSTSLPSKCECAGFARCVENESCHEC